VPDDNPFGTLITNANQGAFYSWYLGFTGASPAHQLTTITGSGSSTISLPVPSTLKLEPMISLALGGRITSAIIWQWGQYLGDGNISYSSLPTRWGQLKGLIFIASEVILNPEANKKYSKDSMIFPAHTPLTFWTMFVNYQRATE
jgi:hypothetical protein